MPQIQELTRGGEFLIKETDPSTIYLSEELDEERLMMRQVVKEFVDTEILPRIEEIDSQEDLTLAPRLLDKAAALGFTAIGTPEEYGGMGMDDFKTSIAGGEEMARAGSFTLTIGVQTSIGIAPILFYGSPEQKAKYLPKMVTCELKSCYCLTEPGAGSDANSGKSKAVLNEAGTHYILNGQKMWITNAGFADMFIVFAKIDDDKNLSAFIVEKAFGGITLGEEEKKMGIKGSSTRQVFFSEVPIPIENLLGERGKGFKIALNVLNTGRFKLGLVGLGVSKMALTYALEYANQRHQFGQAIANFGAIQHKFGEIASRIFALDATLYRTADVIDKTKESMLAEGKSELIAKTSSVAEFAIESAILKVFGSETQSYVVNEGLQVFGGMGFSAEAPMERLYRDARINHIYEGTNEINRMLIVDMLLKRAMKGRINLMQPAQAVAKELTAMPSFDDQPEGPLGAEKQVLLNLKKALLMVTGSAVQKLMMKLEEEQEVLLHLADMIIHIYTFESALLKTEKLILQSSEEAQALKIDLLRIFMHHATDTITRAAKEAIYAHADGDQLGVMLLGVKRFTKVEAVNLKAARRRVAAALIESESWCF